MSNLSSNYPLSAGWASRFRPQKV